MLVDRGVCAVVSMSILEGSASLSHVCPFCIAFINFTKYIIGNKLVNTSHKLYGFTGYNSVKFVNMSHTKACIYRLTMRLSLELCTGGSLNVSFDGACILGKTQIPKSSLLNLGKLGLVCPGNI